MYPYIVLYNYDNGAIIEKRHAVVIANNDIEALNKVKAIYGKDYETIIKAIRIEKMDDNMVVTSDRLLPFIFIMDGDL